MDSFTIVGGEAHGITKTFKQAMFIKVNDPSIYQNLDKFQVSHIWDEVLQDTPALYLR